MKQKRIVFVGFLKGFGGAEKSMIMTANELAKKGYKVSIISLKNNDVSYNVNVNVKCIHIPDCSGGKILKQIKRFWGLKTVLNRIKPELVICFWTQPALFTVILSKFLRFKTIYSERGDPSDKEYKGLLGLFRYLGFKFINGFVFQTESAKSFFSKKIQSRSTVINNPVYIQPNDYSIPDKRRKVIVSVGRLHEQKNHKLLIKAFFEISNLHTDYKLEIYGDGDLKADLNEEVKRLNLENRVKLKGTTNSIHDKIVDASLFVLPSNYEGMPNVLLEAMALGIPCISTNYSPGGVKDLINNGDNGLITSKDSVNELSQAMQYVIKNPKKAEELGKEARNITKTHSADKIIEKWDVLITKIIS